MGRPSRGKFRLGANFSVIWQYREGERYAAEAVYQEGRRSLREGREASRDAVGDHGGQSKRIEEGAARPEGGAVSATGEPRLSA